MSEKSSYSCEKENLEKIKTISEELKEKSYSLKILKTEVNNLVPDGLWAKCKKNVYID